MSQPARLQALRLQGFKSFAERTAVEFVPGINAVIGPNGSGKSNLADALRWALGEQGRALRSRRAEDVVFAGSERRAALGMADVVLVLDNTDGLVPVDYAVLEIGRRLYRSGENDYLVNRQRVRLRDLVELLDAAHLADNAFLFIGQGMVDQALALRPEERRPLFEEVAGVRRHERRRRRSEDQLAEAAANLARVEDILAELRPQVRRLAAQAEQQASRARAGEDLAAALVASFAARWRAVAGDARVAEAALADARQASAAALDTMRSADARAGAAARDLAANASAEVERRGVHEAARSALARLDLEAASADAEAQAMERDLARLARERVDAEARLAEARRELALPAATMDEHLDVELAEVDRSLAEARAEAATLRTASARRSEAEAALRRAAAARAEELDGLRRRLALAARAVAEAGEVVNRARDRASEAAAALEVARVAAADLRAAEEAIREQRESARRDVAVAEAVRLAAADATAAGRARLAALGGRADALRSRMAADDGRGIAMAARRAGGRALAAGLDLDPALRPLVAAALGELGRSFIVDRAALDRLGMQRGVVVLGDAGGAGTRPPATSEVDEARNQAGRVGGGLLVDAVRADPGGAVRRLLARTAWAPNVADAADLAAALPVGWRVVARDGGTAGADGIIELGAADPPLERQAELAALERDLDEARAEASDQASRLAAAEASATAARAADAAARRAETDVAARRRAADEAERNAGRAAERLAREAAWAETRVSALEDERRPLAERLAAMSAASSPATAEASPRATAADAVETDGHAERTARTMPGAPSALAEDSVPAALAAWEARAAELAGRREAVAAARAVSEAQRRIADARRARAEAAAAAAEDRIARAEADAAIASGRRASLEGDRVLRDAARAEAAEREVAARAALDAVRAADAEGRDRVRAAEAGVAAAREALRRVEERHRAAEVRDLEARLAVDAVREQALVEFAALGEAGLRALGAPEAQADDDEGETLATAIAEAGARWAAAPDPMDVPPPSRLVALRRRFHELGAANPFAAHEHAELRLRVDGLEAQRADLVAAIDRTRALLAELDALIARQFRATFDALEAAFDRRFQQLFGGGFARLSLTDPGDLAQTGVEIVARPPGKKAQALAMLSGGERALTAVALLFAMLEVRPVPFCVLDEVDAALDEANVGRFVDALRGLARTTQFVVITHNRGTIEAADALFGVTVGEDAVSRVVSLRIEEAVDIAARIRAGEGDAASPTPSAR